MLLALTVGLFRVQMKEQVIGELLLELELIGLDIDELRKCLELLDGGDVIDDLSVIDFFKDVQEFDSLVLHVAERFLTSIPILLLDGL